MAEVACTCQEWRENLPKINAPIQLQTIRSGGSYKFDGVPFRYCPWCRSPLFDVVGIPSASTQEGQSK